MIQFRRAPIRKTRSASRSAVLRAAPTLKLSSSGMVPLPIGEFRNGSWVRSMNSRISSSARDQAMPLPTTTSGRSADSKALSAASTASGSASVRGGSGTVAASITSSSSTSPRMMSSGKSR